MPRAWCRLFSWHRERIAAVVVDLDRSGSQITAIYAVLNPAKLAPSVTPAARR